MQLTISQKKERVEENNVIKEKVRKNTEMMLTQNETNEEEEAEMLQEELTAGQ